jgi:hypothetical protein
MQLTANKTLHRIESRPRSHGDRGMQMLVGLMFGTPICCALILWAVLR